MSVWLFVCLSYAIFLRSQATNLGKYQMNAHIPGMVEAI